MSSQGSTHTVADIMTRDVRSVGPDASIQEAASMMRDMRTGPFPVVEGGRVVGIITDQDVIAKAVAEGRDQQGTTVGEVMTTEVLSCSPDTEIREAARTMQRSEVRRLVVLEDDQLVGIVSVSDVPTEYVVS